jgi:hypothetical protein
VKKNNRVVKNIACYTFYLQSFKAVGLIYFLISDGPLPVYNIPEGGKAVTLGFFAVTVVTF